MSRHDWLQKAKKQIVEKTFAKRLNFVPVLETINHRGPLMSHPATLLNKIEVTQRLKVCERTLEKLVGKGQFPRGLKLGKQVLWAETAVEKWLNHAPAS